MTVTAPVLRDALADLREQAAPLLPLPSLPARDYGRGHRLFEQRSDQRARIGAWLRHQVSPLGDALALLSVGCGDGALDAELAAALMTGDDRRSVTVDGVEPLAESAQAFRARLGALAPPGPVTVHGVPFEQVRTTATYDAVTFVHSLYYVPDVGQALQHAARLLRPAGRVLVLHAPRAGLNELTATLAPANDGHPQWWAEATTQAVTGSGLSGPCERLTGRLDLTDCLDPDDVEGRLVLDFTVQAQLPEQLRGPVLEVLRALAEPGPALVVDHPVDAWSLRSDSSDGRDSRDSRVGR